MSDHHYQVLARRWRPRRFSELIGQDVVARTLKNALASETLAHAYLLTGIRGVGKTTIARLMSMAINCPHTTDEHEPCNECEACLAIARGGHLDVTEMDAASHTGVDDVRDILDSVRYPPHNLAWRVFIIDEVHMLSRNAFNALLKTLEEPPAYVMFILATTDVDKLPVTVRSRCQRFDLRRLSVTEISQQLHHVFSAENVEAESAAVQRIAQAADGSMRDALSLAERVQAFSRQQITSADVQQALGLLAPELPRHLTDAIIAGNASDAMQQLRQCAEQGYSARALLESLTSLWHQLACCRIAPQMIEETADEDARLWMEAALQQWSHAVLDLHYQVLLHGLRDLPLVDEQCGAEMIVLRLCHLRQLSEPSANSEKKKPRQERQADDRQPSSVSSPSLPLSGKEATGHQYDDWRSAVDAYSELRPAFTALLEHVVCTQFAEHVRLSLDEYLQRSIPMAEREAFEAWLGREVIWQTRQMNNDGQSISAQRQQQKKAEMERLWQQARQDPHIQALMASLNATLQEVLPPSS